ncbi:LysR family transcriptional regulator [Alisedimentitalea sp. MJ-SS2]|uniref:LysR family transcriptional regulator n=1 Tax=Aliisedimentitalea sp. MJ-SS2 TaxID=3049795 RepID=UPI0029099710|nr:LysR family transcriptional regulator [Alisedimentitalea sp. MJ-SS2]MDU8927240.1 LysR family transcriptional regulator [Alisedimentitalea sp. MJ-SS2]
MQPDQLRTLLAIRDTGSLSAAADAVHLSHSAVSLQMKRFEEALGRNLLIKGKRPARLTPFGLALAERAAPILAQLQDLATLATPDSTSGEISIGFVPTTLQTLLPVVLTQMQSRFPDLSIRISSGLSGDLAARVAAGHLTYAFLTAPEADQPDLSLTEIAREPLCVIAPPGTALPSDPLKTLTNQPFIGFSRATWLGTQIAALLRAHAITPSIELDSIDAVENLVALGFGASIVPQRLYATPLDQTMACAPLPRAARHLALAAHKNDDRTTVLNALSNYAKDH